MFYSRWRGNKIFISRVAPGISIYNKSVTKPQGLYGWPLLESQGRGHLFFVLFFFSKKWFTIRFRRFWVDLIFFNFFYEILDFGSLRRPHGTSSGHILLVVVSLHVDEQLYQAIWSLYYWFGCSDSPKLPISCKNAIFAICVHFWAWPLWATFWISIFKLSYYTFPMIEFMYPAL